MQLWNLLQTSRRDFGPRAAVRTRRGDVSFAAMFQAAEVLSREIEAVGLPSGLPLALAFPNGPAFLTAVLALFRLESPAALVSPRYSASELVTVAEGGGVAAFLTLRSDATRIQEMLGTCRTVSLAAQTWGEDLVFVIPAGFETASVPVLAEGAAVLKLTSGSTGTLKGIALGPEQVEAEARNVIETLGLGVDDRILASIPLFHSYDFDLGVLATLFSGACLVLQDFFVPRRICDDLAHEEVTVFLGVPTMYRRMLEEPSGPSVPAPRLRYLLSCTAPLEAETIHAFHARFGLPLCQHYGSSETGAVTNHDPAAVLRHPDSIGRPIRNVQVRIVDEHGTEVALGAEGEVVVTSAAVARGYFLGAPVDGGPFREGSFWTGDLAVRDGDGFIQLRGRKDHVINVGGLKVSPEEVRRTLESHPSVREAAVIGVQDAAGEAAVSAMVTLKQPATEKELIVFCYRALADYKVPRRIHIRDALPRGPAGKVRLRPEDVPLA